MKALAVFILLTSSAVGQAASAGAVCGPPDQAFAVTRDRTQHPTPAPAAGKAVLCVIGSSRFGGSDFRGALGLDGTWVGAVHNRDYFLLPVDPGEHHLCAQFSTRIGPGLAPVFRFGQTRFYYLIARPGGTYYLDLHVGPRYGFDLRLLDPQKGQRLVASSTFSTSQPERSIKRSAPSARP